MALQGLLRLGIETAIERGGRELEELAVSVGLPSDAGLHLQETLVAMPDLLVAIDTVLEEHPERGRVGLWRRVLRYLLTDHDLIPTAGGSPLRGILDDAYLLHRAAQVMRDDLGGVDLRNVDGGAALLRSVLPNAITSALDDRIVDWTKPRGR